MNNLEVIRCFDILAHTLIFFVLLWYAIESPQHKFILNTTSIFTAMVSLFLALTCWKYGRTHLFLALHGFWEYGILFLLTFVIFFEKQRE